MPTIRRLAGTAVVACFGAGLLTGGLATANAKQTAPRIVRASFAETYFDPATKRGYTLMSVLFRTCTTTSPRRLTVTVN